MMAGGRSGGQAIGAAAMLGAATLAGVALTDQISFLIHHGLALSAGVTIYVAASNLVPEFQGKRGWTLPTAFFAGAATLCYETHSGQRLIVGMRDARCEMRDAAISGS